MVCSLNSQTYTLSLTLDNYEFMESSLANANGCPWIICPKFNDCSTHHLAKRLDIRIELGCIYSGMALELLLRVPYKDCIFPVVCTVEFTFSINPDDTGNDVDVSVVQANTTAFVQRLLQLAPRFRKCHLDDHFDYEDFSMVDLGQFSSLARQILVNVDRLKFVLGDEYVGMDLDYEGICNLVHIDYASDVDDWPCFQLVQQCALTLQSLKLGSHPHTMGSGLDSSKLIRDTNGSCIAYSCLQSLYLDIWNESATSERPSFGTFVAFPILRHVNIRSQYPFSDDMLFRGNAAMLESLQMLMEADTVMMLKECQVFTRASHPWLQSVAIYEDGLIPSLFAIYADFIQFVLSIGPSAAVRVLPPMALEQDTPHMLQLLGKHASIQVLSMEGATFTVLDVVALIKLLPLLLDLCLDVPKLDSHLADIPKSQLFEMLIESHTPMGRHVWRLIVRGSQVPLEDLVVFTMLLASLCPNLDFMDVWHNLITHFGRHMKSCTASDPFQKYEQLLQSLQLSVATKHMTARQIFPACGY
ncbi:hypothetical protein GGF42_000082 [Coemansia sp. RSA 2424]|nr:hypothetical protein GGF42_000082 [Coemansia sp. RSA 2424]